nr:hypothetical protein [Tanacetum cinerariifolium]
ALGANCEVSGSSVVDVWMEDGGGIMSARVVSRVVLGLVMKVVLVMLRGWEAFVRWFWIGEHPLEEISMKWLWNYECKSVSRVVLGLVMKVVLVMLRGWEAFVRWFLIGEHSLEEISMKSIHGIFFGGFWVEELALEAIE